MHRYIFKKISMVNMHTCCTTSTQQLNHNKQNKKIKMCNKEVKNIPGMNKLPTQ